MFDLSFRPGRGVVSCSAVGLSIDIVEPDEEFEELEHADASFTVNVDEARLLVWGLIFSGVQKCSGI